MAQILTPRLIPRAVNTVTKRRPTRQDSLEYRDARTRALQLAVAVDAWIMTADEPHDEVSAIYAHRLEETVIDLLALIACTQPKALIHRRSS